MSARRRSVAALAILTLAGGAAVYGTYLLAVQPREGEPSGRCTASLDEASASLSAEQAGNAALIAASSSRLGLPARGATIGIATAMQESSLINIDYGDRDSIGLFQQRPSQGWGSIEQIMDPYYSADTFYTALAKVSGWQDMAVTVAAQTVQRSAFPDAYAKHEGMARLWASALRGHSGSLAVDCDVSAGPGTTAAAFVDRIDHDLGAGAYEVRALASTEDGLWLDVVPAGAERWRRDAFAAWAVAVAATESVEAVVDGTTGWERATGLGAVDAPGAPLGVAVRLLPVEP
ncbi:hypothetical protein [Demequina mangrovi]|uniref:Uncharacterized protein n=1 Tax=Demequina mangrovi TaxID=1043493 RepID=A0A1H6YBP7_9MICO|nr:hypothetical protein [Demequina mangrovi]SEJ34195.1 hypothetical protein SAMN05421637_1482 [Demequina mangrovi]